ncbi:MAG TPA: S8 family peptidase [Rhizomicrobium sp.]|nr:S8 family peptidase [Rhizomicrobium sp.]
MIRKTLVTALMLSAAIVGNSAQAATRLSPMGGTITPFYGTIEPLYGTIEPLYGTIEPLYGTIEPLYGTIEPLYGTIEPLYGTIEPLYGTIEPLNGGINPFYGTIEPLYGTIEPLYGTIEPLAGTINPNYGKVSPLWGDTTQFWGNVSPFYGTIEPLYGTIEPLYGTIEPLYGTIEPLYGTIEPLYAPFWGDVTAFSDSIGPFYNSISPFWRSAGPEWGDINAAWAGLQAANGTDYSAVMAQLQSLLADAGGVFGAAITKATGKSFADYMQPLLAQYGIDLGNPSSLAGIDAQHRSSFFLKWYDTMMGFSGMPRVDWWMGATHWSPELTQIENPGTHAVIGVLDSYFTDQTTNVAHLEFVGGYDYHVNDHGAAVASLIASQHSPDNVMGIAPNSPVLLYNPFDYTGTASWEDVAAGIKALYDHGAYVINASMGVPGQVLSEEWASIMTDPQLNQADHPFVLVKAAGNEGVAQATDINWIGSQAPNNLILVGSVGPTGIISGFSNVPGNACILINGVCDEQNKLMYHYLVAPGENILVSDNNGGVTRMSGTSFAAPLVTGAVALLQDRWPWLKQHPAETVQIIFQSATDLGAPGVDPIYGWGELNIEASQSPLSFDGLLVLPPGSLPNSDYTYSSSMPATSLKAAVLDPGQLNLWQQQGAFIVAFENIGTTFRDFEIPLSSLLTGYQLGVGGENKRFQNYLYQRLIDWADAPGAAGFNSLANRYVSGDWNLSLVATQSTPDEMRRDDAPIHYEFAAFNSAAGVGFRFGEGSGAHSFAGIGGFSLRSDFDPATGGVNPVLGFASGGAYGRAEMLIGKARFSFGYTQKSDDHMYLDDRYGPVQVEKLAPNRAAASHFAVDYELGTSVRLNASFTSLRENDGLLGAQGAGLFDMVRGSSTAATTFGASFDLAGGWKLLGSATMARSASPTFENAALTFTAPNLVSTAYELVAMRANLFADKDSFRISLAQPLHLEAGALRYSSVYVADRDTGRLGSFSQTWDVSGKREYRMEALYGMPFMDGTAHLEGYALVDVNPHLSKTGATELAMGWRAKFELN